MRNFSKPPVDGIQVHQPTSVQLANCHEFMKEAIRKRKLNKKNTTIPVPPQAKYTPESEEPENPEFDKIMETVDYEMKERNEISKETQRKLACMDSKYILKAASKYNVILDQMEECLYQVYMKQKNSEDISLEKKENIGWGWFFAQYTLKKFYKNNEKLYKWQKKLNVAVATYIGSKTGKKILEEKRKKIDVILVNINRNNNHETCRSPKKTKVSTITTSPTPDLTRSTAHLGIDWQNPYPWLKNCSYYGRRY